MQTRAFRSSQNIFTLFFRILLSFSVLGMGGCAFLAGLTETEEERQQRLLREEAVRHHFGFRETPGWKKQTYRNEVLLAKADPSETRIVVSLKDQRAVLLQEDLVLLDFPIASGKRSHPTPPGSYTILQKSKEYRSNLYGKILDAEGNVVDGDADIRTDAIPEGGSFVGSSMPYWLRLTNTGVGLHVGHLPGRPASHGCVRMPSKTAPIVYSLVEKGTPVEIVEQFMPPQPVDSGS